jgi:hypothetical protein
MSTAVAGLQARSAELLGKVERYEDSYRLCDVRRPEGIIVMLAEQIGLTKGFSCRGPSFDEAA